jgi:hypothetical protein
MLGLWKFTVMILYTYKRHFPESLDVCSLCGTEFRGSIEVQHLLLVITSAVSMYLGLSCVWFAKSAFPRLFKDGRN